MMDNVFIAFVAALHGYFLWLEMFGWTTAGQKVFRKSPEFLQSTKAMAANQGLYNGFLASGLIWSILIHDPIWHQNVATFFLVCVVVAGVFGGLTVGKRIFYVQSIPAIVALLILYLF